MEDKIEKEREEGLQPAGSGEPSIETIEKEATGEPTVNTLVNTSERPCDREPYPEEIEKMVELEDVTEAEPEDTMKTIADNLGALCITMMQIRNHLGNIAELMLKQTGK